MPLVELPYELFEMVPQNLIDHKDFMSFTLVCHATHHIVNSGHYVVWRTLAYHHFDIPAIKTGNELKQLYQYRQKVLHREVSFNCGSTTQELESLRLLRELIAESFAGSHGSLVPKSHSNNLETLRSFVQRSDILTHVLRYDGHITRSLKTVQLVLAPLSLQLWKVCPNWSFPDSQWWAYSNPQAFPIFERFLREVNIDIVLHISNFFKRHLTESSEGTLFLDFMNLPKCQKPSMWHMPIHQGLKELGSSWKGTYANLDPKTVRDLRGNKEPGTGNYIDIFHETDDFPYLEIEFHPMDHEPWWPSNFEFELGGLPSRQLVRTLNNLFTGPTIGIPTLPTILGLSATRPDAHLGVHYLQFTGEGSYKPKPSKFHCSGILHPVPPQYGVPGWQRIIMVKCDNKSHTCPSPTANASTPSAPLPGPIYPTELQDCCWVYEGVVLPGGTMIIGRWWSPTETDPRRLTTGPFIYWNVRKGITEAEDEEEEKAVVVPKGKGKAKR